jgi:osmotically-inducible protein OsmY
MVRDLIRIVLIVVIVVAAAAFFFGYRWGGERTAPAFHAGSFFDRPVATTGSHEIDTTRARETGAEIGEKVAVGAHDVKDALKGATLTAKIKSKIALDDTMRSSSIDVSTDDRVVTLSGSAATATQRRRAVQLARETDGVSSVIDRVRVE